MKRPAWVRRSGPFKCVSLGNGNIVVKPVWGQYEEWNLQDGGGPSMGGRMSLAEDLETWLNSVYSETEVATAKQRIEARRR